MTPVVEQFLVALIVLAAATYAGWVLLRPLWARRSPRAGCGGCGGAHDRGSRPRKAGPERS
jgi:hypothetical protein